MNTCPRCLLGRLAAALLVLIGLVAGCGGGADAESLRLLESTPAANSVNDPNVVLSAKFESTLDARSAMSGFTLTDSRGRLVEAVVSVEANQVRLRPVDPLAGGRYTATVAPGVADDSGRTVGTVTNWVFDVAQYLVITVDVEALPNRQSTDHVERLIYGNFPGRGRAGIIEMMDAADKHNVKITFFLDVLEEMIYPSQIKNVAKLIVARGHDLQLHFHPSILPVGFFAELGFRRKSTDKFTPSEAAAFLDRIDHITRDWEVPPFIAFRAGSYRYSSGFIEALPSFGLRFSYNYNHQGVSQRGYGIVNSPIFRWENGVVEIPVSFVGSPESSQVRFDDSSYLPPNDPPIAYDLITLFEQQWDLPNVLVMMFHSWSFLDLSSDHFEYRSPGKAEMFERFLASLPRHVKVVTATELDKLVTDGRMTISRRLTTSEVFR